MMPLASKVVGLLVCTGGLWMEAAFLSNWQGMDRCGNHLWTQVRVR
jgi:hypothetical protein